MKFYEKNLEDLIWDHCQGINGKMTLIDRGFPGIIRHSKIYRQFNLGIYGIADLIAVSMPYKIEEIDYNYLHIRVDIFELKLNECTTDSLNQLCGYMTAVKSLAVSHAIQLLPTIQEDGFIVLPEIYGHLIGASLKDGMHFVLDQTPKIFFTQYDFSLENGLLFKMHAKGWEKNKFKPENTNLGSIRLIDIARSSTEFAKSDYCVKDEEIPY